MAPLYRPYNPTVPTWSPALCRTCDRFEFWICFNFQTWFQSWSSWSHFFLFLHFFEFLKIYFSWRLLQLIFFMIFYGFFRFLYNSSIFLWSEMHKEMPRGCLKCNTASEMPSLISSSDLSLLWEELDCPQADRPEMKSNRD